MNKSAFAFFVISAVATLSACSSSNDDLQQWMVEEAKSMKGQVTPLPPVTPFIPTAYIGKELGDPFAPKKTATKSTSNAPDQARKKDFLENFPLDQLSMVGAIFRQGQRWGLVRVPNGTVTMVKTNDYMGQNFGRIIDVKETGLLLRESILDPQGDWAEREVPFSVIQGPGRPATK